MTYKEFKKKYPKLADKYKEANDEDIIFVSGNKIKILKRY
jgi:hypothetical protein